MIYAPNTQKMKLDNYDDLLEPLKRKSKIYCIISKVMEKNLININQFQHCKDCIDVQKQFY